MQGDGSTERAREGLGIGLTLVRQLVQLHGGHVEAKSEGAGKGSEFLVYLPTLPVCKDTFIRAHDLQRDAVPTVSPAAKKQQSGA
jgi:signal transduction histidine kinase